MTERRPPWFPGQFGRPGDAAPRYTGDPYGAGADGEPYAPAAAHHRGTDPYGDPTAVPATVPGASDWLPDGGGADPAAAPGSPTAGPEAAPGSPTAGPVGYEDFYEPGAAAPADLSRRRSRRRSSRRHGPRGRDRRRNALTAEPADRRNETQTTKGAAHRGAPEPPTDDDPSADGTAGAPPARRRRGVALLALVGAAGAAPARRRRGVALLTLVGVVAAGVALGARAAHDPTSAGRTPSAPTASPPPAPTSPSPAPDSSPSDPASPPSAAPADPPSVPDPLPSPTAVAPLPDETPVGTTVESGPFEVEVLGLSTGVTELAGVTATATAEGEFVVVRLRVRATGPGPSYFLDIDQRLLDAGGGTHEPDARAAMAVDGNRLWFAALDQGESAEGVVVFDVPVGTAPAALAVHASDEGEGARVELTAS